MFDKELTIFLCTVVICLTIIFVSAQLYYRNLNNLIAEMAIAGIDPVAASIALDNIYTGDSNAYYLGKVADKK